MSEPAAAVVVPMTPLLLPGLGGAADPLADLRDVAVAAVRELGDQRVVALCPVGEGAPAAYHHGGETAPLSVLVGRHLCALAGVAAPETTTDCHVDPPPDVGLLVLGEGSARRAEGGPGGLDPRASAFDDRLCAALERGDGRALADLDDDLAEALLVTGRQSLAALGRRLPRARGEVRWRGDPYGVTYLVAAWWALDPSGDADFGEAHRTV